jgi:hypothetical protein
MSSIAAPISSGNIVPKVNVMVEEHRIRVRAPGAPEQNEPRLEVLRSGSQIQGVEIECVCGQIIRLVFEY